MPNFVPFTLEGDQLGLAESDRYREESTRVSRDTLEPIEFEIVYRPDNQPAHPKEESVQVARDENGVAVHFERQGAEAVLHRITVPVTKTIKIRWLNLDRGIRWKVSQA